MGRKAGEKGGNMDTQEKRKQGEGSPLDDLLHGWVSLVEWILERELEGTLPPEPGEKEVGS